MTTSIAGLRGRRVWDSRGRPTVEAEVTLSGGASGRAIAPAGASTGLGEALDLRDGGERYGGFGVDRAIANINGEISDALRSRVLGHVPAKVEELPTGQDQLVRVYDATSVLGKMIAAALKPGLANDQQLREAVDGEAKGILEQIRSLVEL